MLCFVIVLAIAASVQAKCDAGCEVPVRHYDEIGCTPVYAKPEDCCPTHYNCETFASRTDDKCYLNGKVYEQGESLGDIPGHDCSIGCYCDRNNEISCAIVDCLEFFRGLNLGPGCFGKYEDGKCCSTGTMCPPFDNVTKCEIGDETYYEGQMMDALTSGGSCLSCRCKPGFEGKFVEPFCKPLNCGIELWNANKITRKCAPVYFGTTNCCPSQWQCPEESDTIVPIETPGSGEKCSYGDKKLNIGDKIVLQNATDINCECRIPPMVTCLKRSATE